MVKKKEKRVRYLAALLTASMVIPQTMPIIQVFANEPHWQEEKKATPSEAERFVIDSVSSPVDGNLFTEAVMSTADPAGHGEYDLSIIVSDIQSKEWDGTDEVQCRIGLTGVRAGYEKVSLQSYTIRFKDSKVGAEKTVIVENIVLNGEDASHYRLSQELFEFASNAEITKRKLNISGTVADRPYKKGNTKADINIKIENVAMADYDSSGGSLIPGNLSVSVTAHFADEHAGKEKQVVIDDIVLSGNHADNYLVVNRFGDLTGTIQKAGRDAPNLLYSSTAITETDSTMEWRFNAGDWTDCGNAIVLAETGRYEVRYKETDDYLASESFILTLGNKIQKLEDIYFSFEEGYSPVKEYDGTVQAPSRISWSGPAEGDQVELVSYTAAYASAEVGDAIQVSITKPIFSGRDADKYNSYFSGKTLATVYGQITPRTIHVHLAAMDKDYDSTRKADVYVCGHTSFVGDEKPEFAVTGEFDDADAGEDKRVMYGQVSLSGTNCDHYIIGSVTPAKIEDGTLKELPFLSATIRKASQNAPDKQLFSVKDQKITGFTQEMEVLLPGNTEYTDCKGLNEIEISQGSSYLFRYKESKNYKAGEVTTISIGVTKTVTITFDLNGAVVEESCPTTATKMTGQLYGDILKDLTLTDPDLEFAGWFTEKEGGRQVTAGDICDRTEDFTLYAHVQKKAGNRRDGEISVFVPDIVYGELINPQASNIKGDYEKYTFYYKKVNENDSAYSVERPYLPGAYSLKAVAEETDSYYAAEASAEFHITKRILTAAFTPKSRTYNGLTSCAVEGDVSITGGIMSWDGKTDDVAVSGIPSVNFVDKYVGKEKEVRLSGLSLSGSDAEYYELHCGMGTADITPYRLEYKETEIGEDDRNAFSLTAENKTYDETVDAKIASGLTKIGGDDVSIKALGEFTDPNAGIDKEVVVTAITLQGKDAANYQIFRPDSLMLKTEIYKASNRNYPDISGTNPTMGKDNGTITGLTPAMEYSDDGGTSWKTCPDGELTGLAAGEYRVRFSETQNYQASGTKIMTLKNNQVGEKTILVSFDLNGESVTGEYPVSMVAVVGGKFGESLKPLKSADPDRKFVGWFTQKTGGTEVTADTICDSEESMVLYARFQEQKTEEKKQGHIQISLDGFIYGEAGVSPKVINAEGDYLKYTYYYKPAGKTDEFYSTKRPELPGTYVVKAVAAETGHYKEAEATAEFTIKNRDTAVMTGGSSSSSSKSVSTTSGAITGKWEKDTAGHWRFSGGRDYVDEWAYIVNPYADSSKGQEKASWFHFGNDGAMNTGWFSDKDGRVYYLNPVSDNTMGRMLTGWHWLRGKDGLLRCYYFEEKSNGFRGMMYQSASTPDGYTVGRDGAWTVNGETVTRE